MCRYMSTELILIFLFRECNAPCLREKHNISYKMSASHVGRVRDISYSSNINANIEIRYF